MTEKVYAITPSSHDCYTHSHTRAIWYQATALIPLHMHTETGIFPYFDLSAVKSRLDSPLPESEIKACSKEKADLTHSRTGMRSVSSRYVGEIIM